MDLLNNVGCDTELPLSSTSKVGCDVSPKMTQVLTDKLARLEMQVVDLKMAIAALEKNPELTDTLELLRKVNRF